MQYLVFDTKAANLNFLGRDAILTSHAIQCFSRKPIACAPLEIRGIQKALTQLRGSIMDHLEDNHRSTIMYHIKSVKNII